MHNRLTSDWLAGIQSPDQEVRSEAKTLRKRAREMARNNPHARRFKGLVSENVIGPHGITLQARVTRPNGDLDEPINSRIESAFKLWCEPGNCTADRRSSFSEVCQLYMETLAVDGEVFLRILPGFRNSFGFALQVLDADWLDEEFNRPAGNGKNEIRMGVEVDEWNAPLAYHFWSHHPYDPQNGGKRERVRIAADQIIHAFIIARPGQTRGVTWFASALFRWRMLDAFEVAAVTSARIGASKVAVWESTEDANEATAYGASPEIPMDAEPGTMIVAPRGYKLTDWSPEYPNIEYGEFSKAVLRSIAAGLRTSYNLLASDLEGVNYSSIRAGVLSERDVWRLLQQRFVSRVLCRVYPQWMFWAQTVGALQLPTRNVARWQEAHWQPRTWDWVDPLKDISAAKLAIDECLTSRTRVCAAQGTDFYEILREKEREEKAARTAGITLGAASSPDLTDAATEDDEDEETALLIRAFTPHARHATNGNGKGH